MSEENILVMVQPVTKKPTAFLFMADNPILEGPYQNCAYITRAEYDENLGNLYWKPKP